MKSLKPRHKTLSHLGNASLAALAQRKTDSGSSAALAAASTALATAAPAPGVPSATPPIPPMPPGVTQFLAKLSLLYGVPFEYIVADERLLPPESLRFFYLDRNWTDRLVDGALSVGTSSSRDSVFNESFYQTVYQAVDQAQVQLRNTLRKLPPTPLPVGGTLGGFLFRSVVVSGWPGLEVRATQTVTTDGKTTTQPVSILRLDHLSPNVMLALFDGVPDHVEFIEPSESLHFGVIATTPPVPKQDFTILLRGLGVGGYAAGSQIETPPKSQKYVSVPGTFRTGSYAGVVDVLSLQSNIASALGTLTPSGISGDLTSGGFAIEMVRGAGLQAYDKSNASACGS